MSSAKTIAKNTGLLFLIEVFDKLFSFLLIIIITRHLGNVIFGQYSFAFAFVSLFTIISYLGLNTYMFREIAKDKSKTKTLVDNIVTLRLIITLFIFFIAVLIARFWPRANEILLIIVMAEVHEFFSVFNGSIQTVFKAYERNEFQLYSIIIEKTISLGLGAYVLIQGYGLFALLGVLVASKVITSIYNYIISYKNFVRVSFSFDLKLWGNLIKNSLSFWFTLLFERIYYKTDTVMITSLVGYAATGWYNAASTLVIGLTFIPGVIINAVFPALSRFHHTEKKDLLRLLYEKSFYYLLSIALPISIGTSLLAKRIIIFVYKEQFIESGAILQILSWSLLFIFLNYIIGFFLNSINKQKLFTLSSGTCAIINIALNLGLIYFFSYIGAAIATVITQIINFGLLNYFTSKNGYPLNLIKISYKPFIAGMIMGILIKLIGFLQVIYIIPLAATAYFIVLLLIGGLDKEEINLIKSFLPKKS